MWKIEGKAERGILINKLYPHVPQPLNKLLTEELE